MTFHSASGRGAADSSGGELVSDEQLQAAGTAFLLAVQAANRLELQRKRKRMVLLRLAKVAVAILIVITISGLAGMLEFFPQPVEATPFMGLHGLVISSYDLNPVPGIEIRRINADGALQSGSVLVATTNAQGMFDIPATAEATSTRYELHLDGRVISQFQTGTSEQYMRGYEKFIVDVPLARDKRTLVIKIEPGERLAVSESVSIELDQAAPSSWRGSLTDDKQWPSNFLFGQVAAGILKLDGPPTDHLRMTVHVANEVLAYYRAAASDLRVITHSETYKQRELENSPHGWRAHAHQGWYVLGQSVEDYSFLDLQQPQLKIVASDDKRGRCELSWTARPGAPYAVLIAPQKTGEAQTYWLQRRVNGQLWSAPGVQILGRQRLQPLIYSVSYFSPERGRSYRYPAYFYCPSRECWFAEAEEPQDFYHTGYSVPLTAMFAEGAVPGEFLLHLMDFTVTNSVDYTHIRHQGTQTPNLYEINIAAGEIGQITKLTLDGDLIDLAAPPEWDFYCDGIVDAKGYSADLRIQRYGSYSIRAILREKNGNIVFAEKTYECKAPILLGYEPWGTYDVPVLAGQADRPVEAGSIRAVSLKAVASPSAFGYSASSIAGPLVYFAVPPEFQQLPLKEVRCYLYGRAVGGDALPSTSGMQQYLNIDYLLATPSRGANAPLELRGDYVRSDGIVSYVNASGHSWIIKNFLEKVDSGQPLSEAITYLKHENFTFQSKTVFRALTGLDIEHLPAPEEVVKVLRRFQSSPYYAVKYAAATTSELCWTSKLWGLRLQAGQGLVAAIILNDYNLLYAGQWEFYSGRDYPSRIELVAEDGRSWTGYFDYSQLADN